MSAFDKFAFLVRWDLMRIGVATLTYIVLEALKYGIKL